MARKYSFPEGHWNWPVDLTHHHAVRAGDLIFTGGQVDLDPMGVIQNLGDLEAQCRNSMAYMGALLDDLGVDFGDLVRLVVYFVGDASEEARLFGIVEQIIGQDVRPVISMINTPELCYPGLLTEIEGVAMREPGGARIPKHAVHLDDMPALPKAFSHVVRAGDMVFTSEMSALSSAGFVEHAGDISAQTQLMMDRLSRILAVVGAGVGDTAKVSTFYLGGGSSEEWEQSANIRAGFFPDPGPAATGIPLPSFVHEGMMTKIAATAYCGAETVEFAWPDGHWDWSAKMPYKHGNKRGQVIHVGGQVSLNSAAEVLHSGDMVTQTKVAMNNLERVLSDLGATLDDVVKVTTFYQGSASAAVLHENLLIRSGSYSAPGPATTGIPVPVLVYPGMIIEIEAIAVLA